MLFYRFFFLFFFEKMINFANFAGGGFGGKKESGQLRFGGKDRPFKKPIIPMS